MLEFVPGKFFAIVIFGYVFIEVCLASLIAGLEISKLPIFSDSSQVVVLFFPKLKTSSSHYIQCAYATKVSFGAPQQRFSGGTLIMACCREQDSALIVVEPTLITSYSSGMLDL